MTKLARLHEQVYMKASKLSRLVASLKFPACRTGLLKSRENELDFVGAPSKVDLTDSTFK